MRDSAAYQRLRRTPGYQPDPVKQKAGRAGSLARWGVAVRVNLSGLTPQQKADLAAMADKFRDLNGKKQ